jgi:hypothetical protein
VGTIECVREAEVLDAVVRGRWPSAAPGEEDLRQHAMVCPVCADVALVARVLRDERHEAWRDAHVPAAGHVWWRATIRARAESARAAARPITLAQGLGGACAAGVCAALIGLTWPSVAQSLSWVGAALSWGGRMDVLTLAGSALQQTLWPILVPVGICVVLMPLALYLVLSDE